MSTGNYEEAREAFAEEIRRLNATGGAMTRAKIIEEMSRIDGARIASILTGQESGARLAGFELVVASKISLAIKENPVSGLEITAIITGVVEDLKDGGVFVGTEAQAESAPEAPQPDSEV